MDLASVVAALASVGVGVSGSAPNSSVQVDSSRACPPGLAGPEPSGTIHDLGQHFHHVIYGPLVHASGVHEGAEHGARRAENVENCSKWPKMRTLMVGANEAHARLGPECAIGLVSSHMRPTYLLGVAQLLRFWEWQGRQVSP